MTKRKRFLPEHVSRYPDRHKKWRYRYRRAGIDVHIKAEFGTDAWRKEYAELEARGTDGAESPEKYAPGTVGDLQRRYCVVPTRLGPSAVTQGKVRATLDSFKKHYGHELVDEVTFEHLDAIIAARRVKTTVMTPNGLRPFGGVDAAKKLRKELTRMFAFAKKLGMRADNPLEDTEHVKRGPGEKSKGFHTWTEGEITQFRDRHPIGTTPRLAMEIMLWTGHRRGDARLFGPRDIVDGLIEVDQGKTGKEGAMPVAPQLIAAIVAMPPLPADAPAFLLSRKGTPYESASFGNAMRKWCNAAGLPQCSAHGLRKAIMRRMADLEMPNKTMKSVSLHSKDDQVALYTAAANQAKLADSAIGQLAAWETKPVEDRRSELAIAADAALSRWQMSNLGKIGCLTDAQTTEIVGE